MKATGIGFAGIEGAWWLPAAEAYPLPVSVNEELGRIGRALFLLFDCVTDHYRSAISPRLNRLLEYKVPPHIPRLMSSGRVESIRPDFQLFAATDPGGKAVIWPVITELEICPSAHGFAHAMQVGYGLATDLVEAFARYLDGRLLIFAGTSQWSEFLFEQLAFCRALNEIGARGQVLYDRPIKTVADEVRRGRMWQVPMFGIPEKPPTWNDDILGRIQAHDFAPYLWPDSPAWPADVGRAVVFRFGYFDCFSSDKLDYFLRWLSLGATLLNPAMFILDSKTIMAALRLPEVQERLAAVDAGALAVLQRCIPETMLLQETHLARLMEEKDDWVVKYAGYDGGNQAWGGRSLQLGQAHDEQSWRRFLNQSLGLPWPVVTQRAVPSLVLDIEYVDQQGGLRLMRGGHSRLRSFFLRRDEPSGQQTAVPQAVVCGSHITVSHGKMQVAEAVDAVQAPVIFRE